MKILSVIIAFCACAANLVAEEPITNCPLRAAVHYHYPSTNIGGRVEAGDQINILISIRNISTNLIVLSLDSELHYNYRGEPDVILSNFIDKVTGTETRWLAPDGGGGGRPLHGGPSFSSPKISKAYVFLEPGNGWWKDIEFTIPANLGNYPFTAMKYGGAIYAKDSGKEYGLNAWTGKLDVASCTVPLARQIRRMANQQMRRILNRRRLRTVDLNRWQEKNK